MELRFSEQRVNPHPFRRKIQQFLLCICLAIGIGLVGWGCASGPAPLHHDSTMLPNGGLDKSVFVSNWVENFPIDHGDTLKHLSIGPDRVLGASTKGVAYSVNPATGVLDYHIYPQAMENFDAMPAVVGKHLVIERYSSLEIYNLVTGLPEKTIPLTYTITSPICPINDTTMVLGVDSKGGELLHVDLDAPYKAVTWDLLAGGAVNGSPVYFKTAIFFGNDAGELSAVDVDRNAVWSNLSDLRFHTSDRIVGDVAVDDSGLYASNVAGRLVCLDLFNGKLKWEYYAPSALNNGPVVTKNFVYQYVPGTGMVALAKTKVISLTPDNKHDVPQTVRTPQWTCPDAVQFLSSDDLFAYFRTAANGIIAVELQTGVLRFRSATSFSIFTTNVTDPTIFAANTEGVVYSLRPDLRPGSPGYLDQ